MRTIVSIRGPALPRHRRPELAKIYPEGFDDLGYFTVWLAEGDPRVARVLQWFEVEGYRPWNKLNQRTRDVEYDISLVREYGDLDCEQAEYLELFPDICDDTISDVGRDEKGRMLLRRQAVKSKLDFGRGVVEAILVPERVKEVLERQNLKHLIFKPTVATKGTGLAEERCTPVPWDRVGVPPWWELASDLTLPPLSPSMDLRDSRGNRIEPSESAMGCVPRDGFYNHAELHYRRSDLAHVEPFDVARTFESFGPRSPVQRPSLVVSKRFYEVCLAHDLATSWIPIRMEQGTAIESEVSVPSPSHNSVEFVSVQPPLFPSPGTISYATPQDSQYASFTQRAAAWLIDWAALLVVRFAVAIALGGVAFGIESMGLESERVKLIGGLLAFVTLYLCGWLYYAAFESSRLQATPGKQAMRIKVTDLDDGRPTFLQASLRFFFRLVSVLTFGVGFFLMLFTRRRQAMHDIGANCVVVSK